jgi:hypothetical protein
MNIKTMFPEFGGHITKAEGDKLFKKARELDEQGLELFKDALTSKEELIEYYAKPCLGFVFSKEILQELLNKMVMDDHYLVLLTGAKENGRRTIMAFVYKSCEDGLDLDATEIKSLAGKIGTQHPGLLRTVVDKKKEVPMKIRKEDLEGEIN